MGCYARAGAAGSLAAVGPTTLVTGARLIGGPLSATSGLGIMLALVLLAYSAGAWLGLRRALVALMLGAAVVAVTAPLWFWRLVYGF